MNEAVLDEILRQFVDNGQNPSPEAFAALATATGMTVRVLKQHYVSLYQEASGNNDDPFGPVTPVLGDR
jgi:hypothetical protein